MAINRSEFLAAWVFWSPWYETWVANVLCLMIVILVVRLRALFVVSTQQALEPTAMVTSMHLVTALNRDVMLIMWRLVGRRPAVGYWLTREITVDKHLCEQSIEAYNVAIDCIESRHNPWIPSTDKWYRPTGCDVHSSPAGHKLTVQEWSLSQLLTGNCQTHRHVNITQFLNEVSRHCIRYSSVW